MKRDFIQDGYYYDSAFRNSAIQLAQRLGSVRHAAREMGVYRSTLRRWIKATGAKVVPRTGAIPMKRPLVNRWPLVDGMRELLAEIRMGDEQ